MIPLLALVLATAQAGTGAGDSTVYRLTPASRVEVRVGRSGMFGFLGHEHLIRARAIGGRVVYRSAAPGTSRVEVSVPTDSLEVLTPPDTAEIRQVTEVMRTQVLRTASYPEVAFASSAVTPIAGGFRVRGALTIGGVTRDVTVDLMTTFGGDTLRATGAFSVKQTAYGIKPVRAGAGTVRVADAVTIELALVAVSEGS